MPLGMEIDLIPGHIVLDGDPAPLERGTAAPLFSADVYCGETVAHLGYCRAFLLTLLLGMEVQIETILTVTFFHRSPYAIGPLSVLSCTVLSVCPVCLQR